MFAARTFCLIASCDPVMRVDAAPYAYQETSLYRFSVHLSWPGAKGPQAMVWVGGLRDAPWVRRRIWMDLGHRSL